MTKREFLATMVAVGVAGTRKAQHVADMAEERLVAALDDAVEARAELVAWTDATAEAMRRYAAVCRPELGVRIQSLLRPPEEGDVESVRDERRSA